MPKVIDKYVLEEKIGSGQYGEVFKGRHQDTLETVAIKSIRRDMIKGKFYELLESEIKVLKTCDNPHIIKLHALKKTPHNYYLMLEYCNGGDMLAKLRNEGTLPHLEVIRYLSQILNAFHTLVSHKIMHRDFKLANILLHEGNIKIADFGFAKLLSGEDYATTMLGSPLNMAPEVLGGNKYNNKADIWSIGACIYEMVYGKPPYVASNMVDLAKLIRNRPLVLPSEPEICPELRDVLQKMLVADVKKRIEWSQLFCHPVTQYLMKKQRNEVELELEEDESLMLNTSKCYLRHNLVLHDPADIRSHAEVNDYLVEVIKTGRKHQEEHPQPHPQPNPSHKASPSSRKNSKRILHYRNVYAFLASVADQIFSCTQAPHYEIAAYVVTRQILDMISWLLESTEGEKCGVPGVTDWPAYSSDPAFLEIRACLEKELGVFSVFNKDLQPLIRRKALQGAYDADVRDLLGGPLSPSSYRKYLCQFIRGLAQTAGDRAIKNRSLSGGEAEWRLIFFGLKISDFEATFGSGEEEFDFGGFYGVLEGKEEEQMLLEIEEMLSKL